MRPLSKIIIFLIPFLLCNACSSSVTPEVFKGVDSALWMSKQFRDNPNNEGGNENLVYEPSQYVPGSYPIWMRDRSVAHACLILIIANDSGFNESNWISFFHGIRSADIQNVKSRVFNIDSREYLKISKSYPSENSIPYDAFRSKIAKFEGLKLQSMRKENSGQASP